MRSTVTSTPPAAARSASGWLNGSPSAVSWPRSTGCSFDDVLGAAESAATSVGAEDTVIGMSDGDCGNLAGQELDRTNVAIYDYSHSDALGPRTGSQPGAWGTAAKWTVRAPSSVPARNPTAEGVPPAYDGDDIMAWASFDAATDHASLNPNHLATLGLSRLAKR